MSKQKRRQEQRHSGSQELVEKAEKAEKAGVDNYFKKSKFILTSEEIIINLIFG